MAHIHYFQRYSQKENVVTNNTLLLLSRLYTYSPFKFQAFLAGVLQEEIDTPIVGVQFLQQKAGKSSTPDGLLIQQSFKIVVETKLHPKFGVKQLCGHLAAFSDEKTKIVLLLSPVEQSKSYSNHIEDEICLLEPEKSKGVLFTWLTFFELIECFRKALIVERDYELIDLLNDFSSFCSENALLPRNYRMRAVACSRTLADNFKFNLYYDSVNRGYTNHRYIGIYNEKCIWGIGEIENIVTVELYDGRELRILEATSDVTKAQEERIVSAILKAQDRWNLSKDHRFFLVAKFYETEYRKTSTGPLWGVRYFDLDEILENPGSTAEIAERLKSETWR